MRMLALETARLLLPQILVSIVASQDFVPLVLGPDFQRAYDDKDILRGFKLNVQEGENPLKGHVFQGAVDSSPFSTSYTKSAVITSVDDVKEMMEIKGSLSVSYGPMISGSGAGSYLNSKVKSKRQISILYRTRRVAYAKKVDVKTLQPIAGLDRLSPDEIMESYGSKFIDQVLYGAQLDVIFTVESSEDTDFLDIEAELKGKIGFGPLSIEFQANFKKQEGYSRSRYTMEIEARASGIAFGVPSNPSFDQTNELIDTFNAKYEAMLNEVGSGETVDVSNVANQFSPVAFALSPIAEYLPSKLSVEESARFDDKMESLRDIFFHALFIKSQLSKIKGEQELLYGNDPRVSGEIFQPYASVVNDVKGELENKIDECLDFRKRPVREIIGTEHEVPAKFADTLNDMNLLQGLIGELYLPSPVTISGVTFDEYHYIGFALPSKSVEGSTHSSFVPWMGGLLRLDDDDSIIASAYSPDVLAEMGLAELSAGTGHKHLKYGDQIYLQVSNLDYRWLKRNNSTGNAVSRDYFSEAGQSDGANYLWHVRSKVGDLVKSDPKQGHCVKYGDMIFFNANGSWLHRKPDSECASGHVGNILHSASCVDTVEANFQTSRLQWVVRSTHGSRAADNAQDPAHGHCVQYLNKIYLQSNNDGYPLLTGGRGTGNNFVWAQKYYMIGGPSGAGEEQIKAFSDENKCMSIRSQGASATATPEAETCIPTVECDCTGNEGGYYGTYNNCVQRPRSQCRSYCVHCDASDPTRYVGHNSITCPAAEDAAVEVDAAEDTPAIKYKDQVYMNDCGDNDSTAFRFDAQTHQIKQGDRCLDFYVNSNDSGRTNTVYMYGGCHEHLNQKWRYDETTMELKTFQGNKCLDMSGDGDLFMRDCDGGENQKFMFSIDEAADHRSMEWIVRKEVGNGLRDDGFFCPADAAKGSWKEIQTSLEVGVNRTSDFPYWEQNLSWEDSVAASVTSGFKFGAGVDIPWIDAKNVEASVRNALHGPKTIVNEVAAGQAWQFVYEISDSCTPMWELKTEHLAVTDGPGQEPCCLPGHELDPDKPHGPCTFQSACQCDDSVCSPTPDPTTSPSAPSTIRGATNKVTDGDSNSSGRLAAACLTWAPLVVGMAIAARV